MKATHLVLGSDKDFEGRSIIESMSDPTYKISQNLKRHVKMSHESNKTHFKLSPNSKESNLVSTQRHDYKSKKSPVIRSSNFGFQTHFNIGFQKQSFETSYNRSFNAGIFKSFKLI